MARQSHTVQVGTGPYPVLADVDVLTWLAADVANFEEFAYTGKEVILARNVSADTNFDVIITSLASSRTNRTGTITKEVPFGEQIIIGPLGNDGWRQTDGTLHFAGEDASIEFAVVRL